VLRSIFSVIVLLAFLLTGYLMAGGVLVNILHPLPVFIVWVTLSVASALLVFYPLSVIKQALHPDEDSNKAAARRVWLQAERLSYLAGIMSTALGLIITFRFLDQPINAVGTKIGASIMGILLGSIQGIFFRFLRARAV